MNAYQLADFIIHRILFSMQPYVYADDHDIVVMLQQMAQKTDKDLTWLERDELNQLFGRGVTLAEVMQR